MCKTPLLPDQMNSAALIDEAQGYARELVFRESRGPGDTENAMRRIEMRYGVPFQALWSLRYRPPKRIWADLFFRLKAAHEAERQRQLRLLKHEIGISKAAGVARHRLAKAEAVLQSSRSED